MSSTDGSGVSVNRSGGAVSLITGLVAGVVLTAAVAFWLWPSPAGGVGPAAGGPPGGGPPMNFEPSPVEVVAVVETIAAEPVQLLGTVAAVRESLVASEVDGLAAEVAVDEGDAVQLGDVLVRLRTTTLEQQLAAARAAREETQARLARASSDFDRLELLLQRRAISQREYDQAVADRDALTQGVTRLEAEAVRLADLLESATVRAPFTGRVTEVHVEIGEWVDRGDQIVSLVDLSQVEVAVQIAERYISAVRPGFRVDVRFDALPGREYQGAVKAIVPQAIPEARTFPVLIRIGNRDRAIKGGMAARVTAQLGSPKPAVLIPKDAIVRRGAQVLVVLFRPGGPGGAPAADDPPGPVGEGSSGMLEELAVDIGPARGQWQVVYGGISRGDLVVVRGNERVMPGVPVVIAAVRELPVPTADPSKPIAIDPRDTRSQ